MTWRRSRRTCAHSVPSRRRESRRPPSNSPPSSPTTPRRATSSWRSCGALPRSRTQGRATRPGAQPRRSILRRAPRPGVPSVAPVGLGLEARHRTWDLAVVRSLRPAPAVSPSFRATGHDWLVVHRFCEQRELPASSPSRTLRPAPAATSIRCTSPRVYGWKARAAARHIAATADDPAARCCSCTATTSVDAPPATLS